VEVTNKPQTRLWFRNQLAGLRRATIISAVSNHRGGEWVHIINTAQGADSHIKGIYRRRFIAYLSYCSRGLQVFFFSLVPSVLLTVIASHCRLCAVRTKSFQQDAVVPKLSMDRTKCINKKTMNETLTVNHRTERLPFTRHRTSLTVTASNNILANVDMGHLAAVLVKRFECTRHGKLK